MSTVEGIVLMVVLLMLLILLLLAVAFIATLLVVDDKHSIVLEREDTERDETNRPRVAANREDDE